jgi:hypothetical protein
MLTVLSMAKSSQRSLAVPSRLVQVYTTSVQSKDGRAWVAQAWTSKLPRGGWAGWFAFLPDDGGEPVWTDAETTQGRLVSIHYWASGIEPSYLEGALARALDRPRVLRRRLAGRREQLSTCARSYERLARALAEEGRSLRRMADEL